MKIRQFFTLIRGKYETTRLYFLNALTSLVALGSTHSHSLIREQARTEYFKQVLKLWPNFRNDMTERNNYVGHTTCEPHIIFVHS